MHRFSALHRRRAMSVALALGLMGGMAHATALPTPVMHANAADIQTLHQHIWQLKQVQAAREAAIDLPSQAQQRPELQFTPHHANNLGLGRLHVGNLCNSANTTYTIQNQQMSIGPAIATTRRGCADADRAQLQRRVLQQLPKVSGWQLQGVPSGGVLTPTPHALLLVLTLNDGSRWTLTGRPTDEHRHGGQPERIFLEVAAHSSTCQVSNNTFGPDAPCLRVRPVHHDAQGIQRSVGDWRVMREHIEGYTHTPGTQQILRLKHWPASGPNARPTYVLDMVVQRGSIR